VRCGAPRGGEGNDLEGRSTLRLVVDGYRSATYRLVTVACVGRGGHRTATNRCMWPWPPPSRVPNAERAKTMCGRAAWVPAGSMCDLV
jgi:hypothetical protein